MGINGEEEMVFVFVFELSLLCVAYFQSLLQKVRIENVCYDVEYAHNFWQWYQNLCTKNC